MSIGKKDIAMVLAYYPARWVVRMLPYYVAGRLAVVAGNIHYLLPTHLKRVTQLNMSKLMSDTMSPKAIKRAVRYNFIARHRALFDHFYLYKINGETLPYYVKRVEGRENLDQAMAMGRGAIILISHFGSAALTAHVLSLLGHNMAHISSRVSPLVFDMESKTIADKVFETWNTQVEYKIQSKKIGYAPGEAFKASQQILREGKAVMIVLDGSLARRMVSVPFMGQSMRLPSGVAALGVRAVAPFVPAFLTIHPGQERHLEILPPIIPPSNMEEKEAIHYVIAEFTKLMEDYIRKYPDHWFTWVRLETQNTEDGRFEMWAKSFDNAADLFGF